MTPKAFVFPINWMPPVAFLDDWLDLRRIIRNSSEALDFLAHDWRWHISDKIYYDALVACQAAGRNLGSNENARTAFLKALHDADIWIYPR